MEDINECSDALTINLAASHPLDLTYRLAAIHWRASIRRVSGDCVVQLGYGNDPRDMGYAVASEAVRIAAAINALMVCDDNLCETR